MLGDANVERIAAAFDGIGFEVVAGGGAQGAAGGDVETAVVEGALDDAVDDETVGEVGVFVCAEAVGGVVAVAFETVDGEGAAAVVEADDVFFVEVFDGADFDPLAGGFAGGLVFRRVVTRDPGGWDALFGSRGRRWPV